MVQRSIFRPVTLESRIRVQHVIAIPIIAIVAVFAVWASWREYRRADDPTPPVAAARTAAGNQRPVQDQRDSKGTTFQPIVPQSETPIKELPRRDSLGHEDYVLKTNSQDKQEPQQQSSLNDSNRDARLLVNAGDTNKDSFRETLPGSELAAVTPSIEDLADLTEDAHPFEQTIQQVLTSQQSILQGRTPEYVQLVSLNRFGSIRVFTGDKPPTIKQLASINVRTRRPESFEVEAIERFRAGESLVVKSSLATATLVSAIRAQQSCRQCHTQPVGDLTGAITIRYRTPGEKEPKNVFDDL